MANSKWIEDGFAKRLRTERENRNMTQAELAKLLKDRNIDMTWNTVARIEKGTRSVRIDEASAFADVFGVSVDSMLGRTAGGDSPQEHALNALADAARKLVPVIGAAAERLRLAYQELEAQFSRGDLAVMVDDLGAYSVEQQRAVLMYDARSAALYELRFALVGLTQVVEYQVMSPEEVAAKVAKVGESKRLGEVAVAEVRAQREALAKVRAGQRPRKAVKAVAK